MLLEDEPEPKPNQNILCRHPFEESKRAMVIPAKVEKLQLEFWNGETISQELPSLEKVRQRVHESISDLRGDHKRIMNPTPYKVRDCIWMLHTVHNVYYIDFIAGIREWASLQLPSHSLATECSDRAIRITTLLLYINYFTLISYLISLGSLW